MPALFSVRHTCFGALSASVPPHLVLTFCFAIAAGMGWTICRLTGRMPARLLTKRVALFSVLLSAYHLVYLKTFHHAAPIPVSLINYL